MLLLLLLLLRSPPGWAAAAAAAAAATAGSIGSPYGVIPYGLPKRIAGPTEAAAAADDAALDKGAMPPPFTDDRPDDDAVDAPDEDLDMPPTRGDAAAVPGPLPVRCPAMLLAWARATTADRFWLAITCWFAARAAACAAI